MYKIIIYTLLSGFITGCSSASTPSSTHSAEAENSSSAHLDTIGFTPKQIEYAGIEARPFLDTLMSITTSCVGTVSLPPMSKASVSVPLGGFVKEIFVMPNQVVRAGAVLATIANPEYVKLQESYLEYSALTQQLRTEYERQRTLASNEAASVKKMEQAKADYEVVLARLQSAEASLAMLGVSPSDLSTHGIRSALPLKSPIGGCVTELNIHLGRYLDPTEVAVEVLERGHLHLHLSVYEKDIATVAVGDKVRFHLVAYSNKTYDATVESIGEKVVAEERSVTVIAHIDSRDVELKTGMYVNAELHSEGRRVKAVTENAVVNHENHWYVFLYNNGLFERREVVRGLEQGSLIEIGNVDAFSPTDQIVQQGAYYIQAELIKREG